jgi:hypothetical protein
MSEVSDAEIRALDDPEILSAFTRPELPPVAARVFRFLTENQNLVTSVSTGMGAHTTGLDRSKLWQVASAYGVRPSKWLFAIRRFEEGLLKRQAAML